MAMVFNEQIWRREGYVIVEDIQLERYPFFRYLGAFSVNRSDARKAVTSVRYAANVLKNGPNRLLLIFPQGEIRANDARTRADVYNVRVRRRHRDRTDRTRRLRIENR